MISDWIFISGSHNHASLKTKDNCLKLLISSMSVELRGSFWKATIITSCVHFCGDNIFFFPPCFWHVSVNLRDIHLTIIKFFLSFRNRITTGSDDKLQQNREGEKKSSCDRRGENLIDWCLLALPPSQASWQLVLGSDDFTLKIGVEGKLGKYEGHKGQWLLSSSLYLSLPCNSLLWQTVICC